MVQYVYVYYMTGASVTICIDNNSLCFYIFRFYSLVDQSIDDMMVSPVELETLNGIYRFVPKALRSSVPQAAKEFLEVKC